jgi:hypothetical protein
LQLSHQSQSLPAMEKNVTRYTTRKGTFLMSQARGHF